MAGSPFDVFRRNQKTFMVAVTCMAMFSFIFFDQSTMGSGELPITLAVALMALICGGGMWFVGAQRGKGTEYGLGGAAVGAICALIGLTTVRGDVPMVTTTLRSYTESDLLTARRNRMIAEQFVQTVVDPVYRQKNASEFQDGYFGSLDPSDLVLKDVFLAEARQQNIVLDDAAVDRFIRRITDEKLSAEDFRKVIRRLNIDESRLFEVIKSELTANLAARLLRPPVARQGVVTTLTPTPDQYWAEFEKLNLKEELRVAALPVVAFVGELPEPTNAELTAFFNKYKDKFPTPTGTPGFLQPPKVSLGSLAADFEVFENEVVRPTEDELRLFYEQNKPRFRARNLPNDMPSTGTAPADGTAPAADAASALNPANSSKPATEGTPSEKPAATPESPAPEKKSEPETKAEPAKESPAPAGTTESTPPSPTAPSPTEPVAPAPASPAAPEIKPSPEPDPLASLMQESAAVPVVQEGNTAPSSTPEAAPATTPAKADAPAKSEATPAEPATPEQPPATGTATPPATNGPSTSPLMIDPTLPAGTVLDNLPGTVAKDAIQPFEDVRNQIEEMILKERAFAAMRAAISNASSEIETALRLYPTPVEGDKVDEAKRTAAMAEIATKVKEIAGKHKLKYEETSHLSEMELRAKTAGHIGVALETTLDRNPNQQPVPVHTAAFKIDPFRSRFAEDRLVNRDFIYWVIERKPSRVPELSDGPVKDMVVEAWKREKARELAEKRASELVKLAKEGNKPLADIVKDQTITGKPESPVITLRDTNAFSWMTVDSSNPQMSFFKAFLRPALSNVTGVTGAGNDFMRTVFQDLQPGQVGAALNQDRSIVYLVEVTKRAGLPDSGLTSLEELRSEYLATSFIPEKSQFNLPTTYQYLTEGQSMELQQRWFDELRTRFDVKFSDGEVEFIEE
ncbi:hypothetical protein Plim_2201 [Planctopirus limnophila DSM 3776]|uniref:PpiC domain-containing protein n=1 Tax=Planctopirus limnophila (strain ATCC 43296 / DSM 3776 / IFAM 1008 / Mu 290) TaxID=521674 RepID=D5SMX2_PLAL2|nr:hypothetical protein [Planctopirus limnophila]ADG68027.1 hypothetical protein Plim_2201 [Planctopirus limnophila DSM 3776]